MTSIARMTLVAPAILALSACATPLSTLDPSGPSAAAVSILWWVMFWSASAIFVLMMIILAIIWRRPGWARAVQPGKWIVLGGLAVPGVLLTVLVGFALYTGERLLPHPGGDAPLRVNVHGVMWQWQFSYPELGDAGPTSVLHIPAGEPVDVHVTSGDVIHSFWVPRLAGKIDAIPGHENILRIQADRPGSYQGVCAEFCGTGHTRMLFQVQAHDPDTYAQALREALQ